MKRATPDIDATAPATATVPVHDQPMKKAKGAPKAKDGKGAPRVKAEKPAPKATIPVVNDIQAMVDGLNGADPDALLAIHHMPPDLVFEDRCAHEEVGLTNETHQSLCCWALTLCDTSSHQACQLAPRVCTP